MNTNYPSINFIVAGLRNLENGNYKQAINLLSLGSAMEDFEATVNHLEASNGLENEDFSPSVDAQKAVASFIALASNLEQDLNSPVFTDASNIEEALELMLADADQD